MPNNTPIHINFVISDHYWIVGGSALNTVWSTKYVAYVPNTDANYLDWISNNGLDITSRIASEAELIEVLKDRYPRGWPGLYRPELPKSTIISRLITIGKFDAVYAAIKSNPEADAQWFAPDWPNVYCDDPQMLGMFAAVGLTAPEIATVTAGGS